MNATANPRRRSSSFMPLGGVRIAASWSATSRPGADLVTPNALILLRRDLGDYRREWHGGGGGERVGLDAASRDRGRVDFEELDRLIRCILVLHADSDDLRRIRLHAEMPLGKLARCLILRPRHECRIARGRRMRQRASLLSGISAWSLI